MFIHIQKIKEILFMKKDTNSLLVAIVMLVAIHLIPYGDLALYPIRLFLTFIHEAGHAIMALVLGGSIADFTVNNSGAGHVMTNVSSIFKSIIVSNSGYLTSSIFASIMLIWLNRTGKHLDAALFCRNIMFALTIFYALIHGSVNFHDKLFTLGAGTGLFFAFWSLSYLGDYFLGLIMNIIALECIWNSIIDIIVVFKVSFNPNIQSDVTNLQKFTGIPATFWAAIWLIVSLLIIYNAFVISFKRVNWENPPTHVGGFLYYFSPFWVSILFWITCLAIFVACSWVIGVLRHLFCLNVFLSVKSGTFLERYSYKAFANFSAWMSFPGTVYLPCTVLPPTLRQKLFHQSPNGDSIHLELEVEAQFHRTRKFLSSKKSRFGCFVLLRKSPHKVHLESSAYILVGLHFFHLWKHFPIAIFKYLFILCFSISSWLCLFIVPPLSVFVFIKFIFLNLYLLIHICKI